MSAAFSHISVMRDDVLRALSPAAGEVYVDGTFGAGGYARAVLEAADCRVFGIDRDPDAVARGREMETEFPGRVYMIEGRYADMVELLAAQGIDGVDGVMLDIGVSSMQIDDAMRGFSFAKDGPLDMRMEASGPSAADIVNETDEKELADLIYQYGEERRSRAVARAIVRAREEAPITRTLQLAGIVSSVVRPSGKGVHPATRTFQALRIHVNDELGQLRHGLSAAENLLNPNGRLVVVSFHSLEDRLVKRFLISRTGSTPAPSRHVPLVEAGPPPSFIYVQRGLVKPSQAETRANPRARSARLRWAVRTDAPAHPLEDVA